MKPDFSQRLGNPVPRRVRQYARATTPDVEPEPQYSPAFLQAEELARQYGGGRGSKSNHLRLTSEFSELLSEARRWDREFN